MPLLAYLYLPLFAVQLGRLLLFHGVNKTKSKYIMDCNSGITIPTDNCADDGKHGRDRSTAIRHEAKKR